MESSNKFLKRTTNGFVHWCPGCSELHKLHDSWGFNGNLEKPSYTSSFEHTGKITININGKWTGEWVRDNNGNVIDHCCHYILKEGILFYCLNSTHDYAGKTIPLQEIPDFIQEEDLF